MSKFMENEQIPKFVFESFQIKRNGKSLITLLENPYIISLDQLKEEKMGKFGANPTLTSKCILISGEHAEVEDKPVYLACTLEPVSSLAQQRMGPDAPSKARRVRLIAEANPDSTTIYCPLLLRLQQSLVCAGMRIWQNDLLSLLNTEEKALKNLQLQDSMGLYKTIEEKVAKKRFLHQNSRKQGDTYWWNTVPTSYGNINDILSLVFNWLDGEYLPTGELIFPERKTEEPDPATSLAAYKAASEGLPESKDSTESTEEAKEEDDIKEDSKEPELVG